MKKINRRLEKNDFKAKKREMIENYKNTLE